MTWRFLLVACFVAAVVAANAQYQIRDVYSSLDRDLYRGLRRQLSDEIDRLDRKDRWNFTVIAAYRKRTELLTKMVSRGLIIDDDTLQRLVDTVFHRLTAYNALRQKPVRVLISRSPMSNAMCAGEGTFVVTIGLLSRLHNESELAFTLAHEIAHYELQHVRTMTLQRAEHKGATEKSLGKIFGENDKDALAEIDSLRKMVYGSTRYSRAAEMQADSLGLVLMQRAGYGGEMSVSMLSTLDSADYTSARLGLRVLDPLRVPSYPFNDYWLKPRLSVYEKKSASIAFFSRDSLESHPDILMRQEALLKRLKPSPVTAPSLDRAFWNGAIELARFESVASARASGQLDLAMMLALELRATYPENSYTTSAIAKILIILFDVKENRLERYLLPSRMAFYGDELKLVNTFLHNLALNETGELAFGFMNNADNFDPGNREHYLLLWRICDMTRRDNVKDKVKQRYEARFGKDKIYGQMNGGLLTSFADIQKRIVYMLKSP